MLPLRCSNVNNIFGLIRSGINPNTHATDTSVKILNQKPNSIIGTVDARNGDQCCFCNYSNIDKDILSFFYGKILGTKNFILQLN